jgi:Domain of unknown function (DUF3883)
MRPTTWTSTSARAWEIPLRAKSQPVNRHKSLRVRQMIYDYSNYLADLLQSQLKKKLVSYTILSRTRLLIEVKLHKKILKFRILAFALGGTGRGRAGERRLEITSTYEHALEPEPGITDLVLGVERENGWLVGIDSDRLNFGGPTSNASTFVYTEGFEALGIKSHDVRLTPSKLIDDEKQVYMQPSFLSEYVMAARSLHKVGISTESSPPPSDTIAERPSVKLSFEEQLKLALRKMEIGKRGEQLVLQDEVSRLSKKHPSLARKVEWTSQVYPYRGYDIVSFEETAVPIYLEVKASTGAVRSFHFTENEFKTAERLENAYEIVCVSRVLAATPQFYRIRNPAAKISNGDLKFSRDGLIVYL